MWRPSTSRDDVLMHYAKGQKAKNHKYIDIINGRYIYPRAGQINGKKVANFLLDLYNPRGAANRSVLKYAADHLKTNGNGPANNQGINTRKRKAANQPTSTQKSGGKHRRYTHGGSSGKTNGGSSGTFAKTNHGGKTWKRDDVRIVSRPTRAAEKSASRAAQYQGSYYNDVNKTLAKRAKANNYAKKSSAAASAAQKKNKTPVVKRSVKDRLIAKGKRVLIKYQNLLKKKLKKVKKDLWG